MSEAIGEMILPGTYIEVRSEGLIGVGGISTGNLGVVGTASRGEVGKVKILGSYSEALDAFGSYDRWTGADTDLSLTRTLEQLFKGGASTVYAARVASGDVAARTWTLSATGPSPEILRLTANSPGTWANAISVAVTAGELIVSLGRNRQVFAIETAEKLVAALREDSSSLLKGEVIGADAAAITANNARVPISAAAGAVVASNLSGISTTELAAGLALLATEPVNIVVAAGFSAKAAAGTMLAHLEATENDGRERIAVMGASTDTVATLVADDAGAGSNPRLVLVAPGILADDAARVGERDKQVKLSASYSAALVAGRLSTLATHVSLTNKDVAVDGLTKDYTRAEQKNLLNNRVLVLQKNLGYRVLKGISTDTGAFRQISIRRTVDFAKAGVRIGANPYIGRLNNARVRSALKATLDGFLSGMVLDEQLIGYTLDVSATRAQEINGIALVAMTLQPTFSIDFVKVIMNLA